MRNMRVTDEFLAHGGSELAPTSTTHNPEIAVRYAKVWSANGERDDEQALIFRVLVEDFMHQGPDLSFLSAFPHEKEALYPPLTFFKPHGKPRHLTYDGTKFTIIDVKPAFPS